MTLGGITPTQKMALAAYFHFWRLLKMGGLPFDCQKERTERRQRDIAEGGGGIGPAQRPLAQKRDKRHYLIALGFPIGPLDTGDVIDGGENRMSCLLRSKVFE